MAINLILTTERNFKLDENNVGPIFFPERSIHSNGRDTDFSMITAEELNHRLIIDEAQTKNTE